MEIEIGINSDQGNIGKTTVAIIIARALREAFPDKEITLIDPEHNGVESRMGTEQEFTIPATSIKIIDNMKLYKGQMNGGYQDHVKIIPVEGQAFQDSTAVLIDAYACGEARGGMEWSDLDQALALAMQERPGLYEKRLTAHRAKDVPFVTHPIDDSVTEDKSDV